MTEVLVTITLLGLTGTAVLGAMVTATKGSSISKDKAASMLWLQSSADYVSTKVPFMACGTDAKAAYETELRKPGAPASSVGWDNANLIVQGVRYWSGTSFSPGTTCTAANNVIQEITLRATNPNQTSTSQLVVVKVNPNP